MIAVSTDHLKQIVERNRFQLGEENLILLGFRGAVPIAPQDFSFAPEQQLSITNIDYTHPRCTLLQWLRAENTFAAFPGSTVPHKKYISQALTLSGAGANQMMTGFYNDYRRGTHLVNKPTGHEAFVQMSQRPVRRTANDLNFDNLDRFEITNPGDNLHAGWSMGVDHDTYGSAGCQVVVGYPECEQRAGKPAVGAWKEFKANAYAMEQKAFPYVLLNARELEQAVLVPDKLPLKLRFGSRDPLVSELQTALKREGFYEGDVDDDFGPRTHRAVMAFQESHFGPEADDGIVGPVVAQALGIAWPAASAHAAAGAL